MGDDDKSVIVDDAVDADLWILADWFSDVFRREGWTWDRWTPSASDIVETIRELKAGIGKGDWIESGRIRVHRNKNGTYEVILIAASVDEVSISDSE